MKNSKLYKTGLLFFRKNNLLLTFFFASLLFCDQFTKHLILQHSSGSLLFTKNIFPFFNIVFVLNDGVSFGILANTGSKNYLIVLTTLLCFVILFFIYKEPKYIAKVAFCFVLSGALGNLIDRVIFGGVIDFLDFFITINQMQYHWPAFNIADSCIFIGVCTLLYYEYLIKKTNRPLL